RNVTKKEKSKRTPVRSDERPPQALSPNESDGPMVLWHDRLRALASLFGRPSAIDPRAELTDVADNNVGWWITCGGIRDGRLAAQDQNRHGARLLGHNNIRVDP